MGMKQQQSIWISIVLYGLVAMSLFLTWRILIVPSTTVQVQGVNPSGQGTTVSNTNVIDLEDLFAPYQMAVHSNTNTYITQDDEIMADVQKFLATWKMRDVTLDETFTELEYRELLLQTGRIELRFPASAHLNMLSHYFEGVPEELQNHQINRILISTNQNEPIYLVNDQNRNVYRAERPESPLQPLISLYADQQEQFYLADAFAFSEGLTFLPQGEITVPSLFYLVEKQPNSFFINQLFDDTTELRDDSNDYVTAYSDNISELRLNKETGVLFYYRNTLDQTNNPPSQQVRDSFHALKFIDTWTQATYFSGYDDQSREILYRRFIEGLPIFSAQERGYIRMEMSNNYLIRIQYPTEVIQTPLTDREEQVTLPSAREVRDVLTSNGYNFADIEMMQVGYQWLSSEESSRIAELEPKWFVKMGGSWRTVESWLMVMGAGDELGL